MEGWMLALAVITVGFGGAFGLKLFQDRVEHSSANCTEADLEVMRRMLAADGRLEVEGRPVSLYFRHADKTLEIRAPTRWRGWFALRPSGMPVSQFGIGSRLEVGAVGVDGSAMFYGDRQVMPRLAGCADELRWFVRQHPILLHVDGGEVRVAREFHVVSRLPDRDFFEKCIWVAAGVARALEEP